MTGRIFLTIFFVLFLASPVFARESGYTGGWAGSGPHDPEAIHDNVDSEISEITEKVTPADDDWIVIEDSADDNEKKKVKMKNIFLMRVPGGFTTLEVTEAFTSIGTADMSNLTVVYLTVTGAADFTGAITTFPTPTAGGNPVTFGYAAVNFEPLLKPISRTANFTVAISDTYNRTIYMANASTFTVPKIQDPLTTDRVQMFSVVAQSDHTVTIDVDVADTIFMRGVKLDPGDTIDSNGLWGCEAHFMAASDGKTWLVTEPSPTWYDGGET